jgi:hypothetical protein
MTSSYTTNKQIEKPAHNDYVDTWEIPVNSNSDIIDACLGNVTYINMTGLSSYSLTYANLRAGTIVFQNTLNNATVRVEMPTGVSGSFSIINSTSAAGTSSLLRLAWSSGGNTFDINQSETIQMSADGSTNTWLQAGPSYLPGSADISVASSGVTITTAQGRYRTFTFTGAVPGGGCTVTWPSIGLGQTYAFKKSFTANNVSILSPVGGAGATLTPSGGAFIALTNTGWLQLI